MRSHLINDIEVLFKTFLSKELASRFSNLLHMKESHWEKIDPWKIWEDRTVSPQHLIRWNQSASDLLTKMKRLDLGTIEAVVLRCGHDMPSINKRVLSLEMFEGMLEGFISVVPEKLAVVINHDGDIAVLCRAPFNTSLGADTMRRHA